MSTSCGSTSNLKHIEACAYTQLNRLHNKIEMLVWAPQMEAQQNCMSKKGNEPVRTGFLRSSWKGWHDLSIPLREPSVRTVGSIERSKTFQTFQQLQKMILKLKKSTPKMANKDTRNQLHRKFAIWGFKESAINRSKLARVASLTSSVVQQCRTWEVY